MRNYMTCLIVLLAIIPLVALGGVRALPESNLLYPALVTLDTGKTGSAFYVKDGSHVFLATAKQVIFEPSSGALMGTTATVLSYAAEASSTAEVEIVLDLKRLSAAHEIRGHPTHDALVVRVAKIPTPGSMHDMPLTTGIVAAKMPPGGVVPFGLADMVRFDEVLVSNDIYLFGFPTTLGLKEMPQVDARRPLLRKGIIAGKNYTRRMIIIDAASYPGNSGGPVLQVSRESLTTTTFVLMGLVGEFVPFADRFVSQRFGYGSISLTNSGYTVVTPTDALLDLIRPPPAPRSPDAPRPAPH